MRFADTILVFRLQRMHRNDEVECGAVATAPMYDWMYFVRRLSKGGICEATPAFPFIYARERIMNRLLDIGFQLAGHWHLVDGELALELHRFGSQKNILYAFVANGDVMYVGKTVRTLARRMYGYKNPNPTQSTNVKNHARIKELLRADAPIEVYTLPDNGLMHYGQFHLNLAGGLEDSIISVLSPEWNVTSKRDKSIDPGGDQAESVDTFTITMGKSYLNGGFFNLPVAHSESVGADGQQIDILCDGSNQAIIASINRRCNANGTPRIMGGSGLRDWLQANLRLKEQIRVDVMSPNTIKIGLAR